MSEVTDVVARYVPEGEPLTAARWADALRDGHLLGQVCEDCGTVLGVPKSVCPDCSGRALSATRLPEVGEVYSETTIEVTPSGHDDRYQVAVVDLGETRVLARVENAVEIGDEVAFAGVVEPEDVPAPVFE